jgi:hypothetical protein
VRRSVDADGSTRNHDPPTQCGVAPELIREVQGLIVGATRADDGKGTAQIGKRTDDAE